MSLKYQLKIQLKIQNKQKRESVLLSDSNILYFGKAVVHIRPCEIILL